MPLENSRTAYMEASASGASHVGLLVLVYDALARDLRSAGEAIQRRDIAGRCAHSNHAFALLAHLENWTKYLDDPTLQESLKSFYHVVRSQLSVNQTAETPAALEALATLVTETRAAWQTKEQSLQEQKKFSVAAQGAESPSVDTGRHSPRSSWSA